MSDRLQNLPTYSALVDQHFGDTVKGKANPYTAMNGNMYSFLDSDGRICLRMSEDDRARFAEIFETAPVEQYGAIMRGYVAIPNARLNDGAVVDEAFSLCLAHARSLPAK